MYFFVRLTNFPIFATLNLFVTATVTVLVILSDTTCPGGGAKEKQDGK